MNRRKNLFDRSIDKFAAPSGILCGAFVAIVFFGMARAVAFKYGAELTHHWYDAPACSILRLFF